MQKNKKMLYRTLGKSNIEISVLSFGTMRWLSEESCFDAVQRGIDEGMNYFDCSTGYVNGMSEVWTGRAVQARRKDVYVSSKSQYGRAPNEPAVRRAIENSLMRSGLDYFDYYQLWGLSTMETLELALKKGGFIDGVHRAMDDGLIRQGVGFTFHGTPDVFRAAVDSGVFLSATVSYNMRNRAEAENIRYAADRGVGILIMNPLGGGVLAGAGQGKGKGTWYDALRFLLDNDGITSALLGVSNEEQVEQDISVLDSYTIQGKIDLSTMMEKPIAAKPMEGNFCTGCRYCEVCSYGFEPSRLMQAIRSAKDADIKNGITTAYAGIVLEEMLAKCIECGQCETQCPQKLAIVAEIRKVKEAFR